ncbi:unnamed protein product, partial [Rotaria socialis]
CELEWNWKDDVVTTICKHTFHRHCAQERLDERNRADCRSCGKGSALRDALSRNKTTTTMKKSMETKSDDSVRADTHVASVAKTEDTMKKKENMWQCDACSGTNDESAKRCVFCRVPRFAASFVSTAQTQRQEERTTDEYNQIEYLNRTPKNNDHTSLYSKVQEYMDVDEPMVNKSPRGFYTNYSLRSSTPSTTSKQDFQSIESDNQEYSSEHEAIVYISDLPPSIQDDLQLHRLIENRLEKTFQIIPTIIQCYTKIGAGFMRVRNTQIKNRLVEDIKKIILDLPGGTHLISFSDTIEIVSYIVIDKTHEKNDINLPNPSEILKRWVHLYTGEKPHSCDQISVQFPNIYRIVSTSFDDLLAAMSNPDFLINKLFTHVYIGADCSYFEDLPKSTTKEELETAICNSIGMKTIATLSLHIELNKQTNNACVIATDKARLWTTKSFTYINDRPISKRVNLTCRLVVYPMREIHNNDEIVNQTIFDGHASVIERSGENLILEISDKKIYDNCLSVGVLTLKSKP